MDWPTRSWSFMYRSGTEPICFQELTMTHHRQLFLSLVLCSVLAACGGSDSPTGPNSASDTRTIKPFPSFATDIVEIFTRQGCVAGNCHGAGHGGGADAGLILMDPLSRAVLGRTAPTDAFTDRRTAADNFTNRGCAGGKCHSAGESAYPGGLVLLTNPSTTYTNLVGKLSPRSGEVRVIVNDAANSYLVKKLEGTQGIGNGERMPLGGSVLDSTDLANIKNWINTGAPNN